MGATAPSSDALGNAVTAMTTRVELVSQGIDAGVHPVPATCIADRLVTDASLASLLQKSELSDAEEQQVEGSIQQFASACASS